MRSFYSYCRLLSENIPSHSDLKIPRYGDQFAGKSPEQIGYALKVGISMSVECARSVLVLIEDLDIRGQLSSYLDLVTRWLRGHNVSREQLIDAAANANVPANADAAARGAANAVWSAAWAAANATRIAAWAAANAVNAANSAHAANAAAGGSIRVPYTEDQIRDAISQALHQNPVIPNKESELEDNVYKNADRSYSRSYDYSKQASRLRRIASKPLKDITKKDIEFVLKMSDLIGIKQFSAVQSSSGDEMNLDIAKFLKILEDIHHSPRNLTRWAETIYHDYRLKLTLQYILRHNI